MTGIEWTGRTWNCVRGCSRISPGCKHCYAEVQAARIVRMGKGKPTPYDGLVKLVGGEARWTGKVVLDPVKLAAPLSWRAPQTVFVNSMSDLFHEVLSNEQIAAVFGVMAATPQHTYQVLTKRAKRMRAWFAWLHDGHVPHPGKPYNSGRHRREVILRAAMAEMESVIETFPNWTKDEWPLRNVHLGVSVENQAAADERIPELLATPAAVRLLSCEPLLESLDLTDCLGVWTHCPDCGRGVSIDEDGCCATCGRDAYHYGVDWVIAGCESGAGARRCDVAWLRSLRDQCRAASVPYFLKQATAVPEAVIAPDDVEPGCVTTCTQSGQRWIDVVMMGPGSKRKPGPGGVIGAPYLDGRQHLAMPSKEGDLG